jgi:glutamyl-tRNA reductase
MSIVLIGFTHKQAPFELLGRIALTRDALEAFLPATLSGSPLTELVGVATCNRTEFYCHAESAVAAQAYLLEAFARARGLEAAELAPYCLMLQDREAEHHLLAVACGIDSLVVGELEILGQVRTALDTARGCRTVGPVLERLFTSAIRTGRRARAQTQISRGNLSVATAAVAQLQVQFPDLADRAALIIGTGAMGEQTLKALASRGVRAMMLTNRTGERARTLAESMGCTPIPMESIVDAVTRADIIVCATGAPHLIVTGEMARKAAAADPRPRVYVDLSVPPNIDSAVRAIEGASLLTLDGLQAIAEQNSERRREEVARVEELISTELDRLERWRGSLPAEELVAEFRREMEAIRRHHLDRYGRRFDEHHRYELDKFTHSLVDALLHRITEHLAELRADDAEGASELELAEKILGIEKLHAPATHR